MLNIDKKVHLLAPRLSGGEKQRVAIARALINKPQIILADEPTANLDSKNGEKICQLLKDLAKKNGSSVIVVTHDNRIEKIADRILWLEDGKIFEKKEK